MARYAVIGAGRTGRAAALDLALHGGAERIVLLDVDGARAEDAAAWVAARTGVSASGAALDAADEAAAASALDGLDAAMSCAPYRLNAGLARAAVRAGVHFCDLGGNTAIVEEELALDADARARGVSVVPDCGLAPGLVNALAAAGIARLGRCRSVRAWCGGLPRVPRPPLGYSLVFSVQGLLNEYSGEAIELRGGEIVRVPALTEVEHVDWPGLGVLEAFVTSGGTSTAPMTFRGRVERYSYKTLRYPGHVERIHLLADLGLLDEEPSVVVDGRPLAPRRVLEAVLERRLAEPEPDDLVLLRVACEGERAGRAVRLVFELEDRRDPDTGLTAMERTTAFPAAAVLAAQVEGRVPAGAHPVERALEPEPYLAAVRRRGLDLREREEAAG